MYASVDGVHMDRSAELCAERVCGRLIVGAIKYQPTPTCSPHLSGMVERPSKAPPWTEIAQEA